MRVRASLINAFVILKLSTSASGCRWSALANADQHHPDADVDNFRITKAFINEARTLKRFRARAMGRASGIKKRSSHITLEIGY